MSNIALPLMIQPMVIQQQGVIIYFPQVVSHFNEMIKNKINQKIDETVRRLVQNQYQEQDVSHFDEMIGTFEIKTNERNVLSITFTNYAIAKNFAHGLTLMDSLTFDVLTGEVYPLEKLFKPNSDYVKRISKIIKQQIKERDIPVLQPFEKIERNQSYYIADKSLVIYFPVYALTPGYYGFPMFPISVYELEDIVIEDGPLGVMLGN